VPVFFLVQIQLKPLHSISGDARSQLHDVLSNEPVDELPADTEPEDGPELRGVAPVVTQETEWDEDVHLPTFSTPAVSQGFAEEEARDLQATVFNRLSRAILGNSSA
jgi:hypothetical protein